ncbi:CDP-glycerol glycerophosphotransferase family protein [Pediococcus pentosaceus]|uniref:CDP-glycerol glycerophosphotransferase family protein n=1 Tax=Pediococcus pentosaceus TaxID=1255 RepID=UPI0013309D06|nr:CDP-glycerol glycerophosphotransferase family protein [Pediococcus pentosaceus]KAF0507029.1 CDP-glycerol--glycerophosphate glycerophosphotransferase [Pediococcus pentosaceus]
MMKNLLKRNKIMALLVTYSGIFLFKIIQKFVKIQENRILFVSFAGKQFSDSPKAIYEKLKDNDKSLELVWAFVEPNKVKMDVGCKVKINSLSYLIELAKSKYWLSNASIERLIPFKSGAHVYINTWHGTPLKKLGKDDKKSDFLVKNWYEKADIDYFTVSSDYDFEIFKEVFPQIKHFIKGGLPRNEILYKAKDDAILEKGIRNKIEKLFNLDKNKKTILYAPTFRDTRKLTEKFDQILNNDKFNKLSEKYNIIFRGHYFKESSNSNNMIDVSNYSDINELFISADILITDYSSVMFDFSILNKKIILFTPDYDEYVQERGFYVKPQALKLPIFYEISDLFGYLTSKNLKLNTDDTLEFGHHYNMYPFTSIEEIIKLIEKKKRLL